MPRFKRKATVEDCIRLATEWASKNDVDWRNALNFLVGATEDAHPEVSKALAELDEALVAAAVRRLRKFTHQNAVAKF